MNDFQGNYALGSQIFADTIDGILHPNESRRLNLGALGQLKEIDRLTTESVDRAEVRIPELQDGFMGLTGSNWGHISGGTLSLGSVALLMVPTIVKIIDMTQPDENGTRQPSTAEIATQIVGLVGVLFATVAWAFHSKNARKENVYTAVNKRDSDAVGEMQQFLKTLSALQTSIQSYARGAVQGKAVVANRQDLTLGLKKLDEIYPRLSVQEQRKVPSLGILKEKLIFQLSKKHPLRQKYDRVCFLAQLLSYKEKELTNSQRVKKSPSKGKEKESSSLEENLESHKVFVEKLDSFKNGLKAGNLQKKKLLFGVERSQIKESVRICWMSLEKNCGSVESVPIGEHGLRFSRNGEIFNPFVAGISIRNGNLELDETEDSTIIGGL